MSRLMEYDYYVALITVTATEEDEEKSGQYQKFAVFNSAQFAKLLYEEFLK